MTPGSAIIIGNTDGIGLAFTKELLGLGWRIDGFSRSASSVVHEAYAHETVSVTDDAFTVAVRTRVEKGPVDLCVYCAGIGEELDLSDMSGEAGIFEVNLTGMVKAASCVIPAMARAGKGHFIGISSLADRMLSPDSPSYSASKAGFSNYLESLALAVRPAGVYVTNICFGFVDTKMAKSDVKPFMMSTDKAVRHLLRCMEKRPVRYSAPLIMVPVAGLLNLLNRLKTMI